MSAFSAALGGGGTAGTRRYQLPTDNGGFSGGIDRTIQGPTGSLSGSSSGSDMNQQGAASDPFGYTMGSLLTPWTKQFQYTPSAGSGEQPESGTPGTPPPAFAYPEFSYNVRDVGNYQAPDKFTAPSGPFSYQAFSPTQMSFTGGRIAGPAAFAAPVSPYQQGAFQPTANFVADRFTAPADYQAPTPFVMGDITQDPSYQFRRDQGQQVLENSAAARGILRTGGTMKDLIDYGQQAASQEYANAYARQFGAYQVNAQLAQDAYDRQMAARTATYDRNYQAGLTENELGYNRAADQWDRQFNAGMAQNEQAYTRAASEYDRRVQNQMAVDQANYGRASTEYDRNYANELARYQMGYQNAANEYDRTFGNALNAYQVNAQTGLNAYQANAQNAAAMGQLGLNAATAGYDRNFNAYQTAFGIDEARRQAAAAGGGGGLTPAQDYNRQLAQYQMEHDIYQENQANQFNRLVTLAQLGQGSAGAVGAYGSNYGANAGNLITGMGNAAAAGQVGSANAWNQGLAGAGNAGMSLGMLAMLNAQQQPQPFTMSM